jgi:hypothetical protein
MDNIIQVNDRKFKPAAQDERLLERETCVRAQMEMIANLMEYSKDETATDILENAYNELLDHIVTLHQPMYEEVTA